MSLFCYACHRISEEEKPDCDFDSYELVEANCELPKPRELDGDTIEFLECVFPGEHIKAYKVRSSKTYENYLFATVSSFIVNDAEFNEWFSKRKKFKHKNVTSCIKYGVLPGQIHYILSEHPHGESLLEALHTDGEMKAKICVYVADQMLDALIALREEGIFHGNIMPSKCLLIEDSDNPNLLKLAGLSLPDKCFTNLEDKPGKRFPESISLLYVAPERVLGAPPCESSEIYSVGAVMYECLSGIPAFTANSKEDLLKKLTEGHLLPLRGVAPELAIPPAIDAFVLKAMSKDPKDRFASFEEMREKLLDAAESSRIYVLEDVEDAKFMPPVIHKRLTQENPVLTEEKIKEVEEATQKEEDERIRADLEKAATNLKKSNSILMVVAIVAVVCLIVLLLQRS